MHGPPGMFEIVTMNFLGLIEHRKRQDDQHEGRYEGL